MNRSRERRLFVAAFLLPACALYGLFVVVPVVQACGIAMYRWRGVSEQRTFVGLANFSRLAADPVARQAALHNLEILAGAGVAILAIGLAVAHALHGESRVARLLRGVYLFPQIISLVIVAILWQFVYNPSFGILTGIARTAAEVRGYHGELPAWLGTRATALPAVGVVFVWHALGFYIMLFSAGLRTITEDVWDAARLDGAGGYTRLIRVTLPLLWSVLRVALIYLVINALNVFALVFLMTAGGPDRSTEVMLTYLYEQAFKNSDFGYATALAAVDFLLVMALSGLVLAAFRRDPREGVA